MENLKVTVPTVVLQNLVSRAVKASTCVDLLPLTSLMQVRIKDNKLSVRTTDNINYVTMEAAVNAPDFEVIVDSKKFSQLISKLTKFTSIKMSVEGNKVVVETDSAQYNLDSATDVDGSKINFPEPTFEANGSTVNVDSNSIRSILSLNKSCKPVHKDTPELFNYYFDDKRAITTDQFRGCLNKVKFSDRPIVLTPTLMELVPILLEDDGAYGVDVVQNDRNIMFMSPKGTIVGVKPSDADLQKYPALDLIELFEEGMTNKVEINRTFLLDAIDRIGLFLADYENNKVSFIFGKDGLTLLSASTKSKELVPYMPSTVVNFEETTLELDGKALKEELSAYTSETVNLKFEAGSGIMMEITNNNNEVVTHLVLGVFEDESMLEEEELATV